MQSFVQPGKAVTLTAPYAVASGAGCLVGTMFGVATGAVANGADGEFLLDGVFRLTALTADVAAQGAAIYWDNTNKRCTVTSAGNTKIGVAVVAKTGTDTTVVVRLNGAF